MELMKLTRDSVAATVEAQSDIGKSAFDTQTLRKAICALTGARITILLSLPDETIGAPEQKPVLSSDSSLSLDRLDFERLVQLCVGASGYGVVSQDDDSGSLGLLLEQVQAQTCLIWPLRTETRLIGLLLLFDLPDRDLDSFRGQLQGCASLLESYLVKSEMLMQKEKQIQAAQKELSSASERYRRILELNPIGIQIYTLAQDGQLRLESSNLAADRILDIELDELLGEPIEEVFASLQKNVDLQNEEISLRAKECALGGISWSNQLSILEDGRTKQALELHIYQAAAGSVVVALQDLTPRFQVQEQLLLSQKMESVGRLAGGIAHDFNNLLGAIVGYADLMLVDMEADNPLRADLSEISAISRRASELTKQLLTFSRRQVLQEKTVSLNEILGGLESMLRRLIGEDIELVVRQSPGLGAVRADPGQIEQLIMNLVVNARDAMPNGGVLRIETEDIEYDKVNVAFRPTLKPGRYVMLQVTDTGLGMDRKTRQQIFEPFFTTKEQGKGTGLGLSTAYGIASRAGGTITVQSELNRGATFQVYLPRVSTKAHTSREESTGEIKRGAETIMLVEDEGILRGLGRRMLNHLGYRVLVANDGDQALQLSKNHPDRIDLLLTDVVMPKVDGQKLADQMAQSRPGMKVLFMSGYLDGPQQRLNVIRGNAFIQKPFSTATLAAKIRQILDQGPAYQPSQEGEQSL